MHSIFLVIITVVSSIAAQHNYYTWGQSYYPGFAYQYGGLPQPSQQIQYVSPTQQQHLISLAQQQQQKLLAMSQINKPQTVMYTQIPGGNPLRSKWPMYKPQYAYTKAVQSFVRPQKSVEKVPTFVKMPVSYAYASPSIQIRNITKTQAISPNHMIKPIYMTLGQTILPNQMQTHKYIMQQQPLKYAQVINTLPSSTVSKPGSLPLHIPQKNYIALQNPKNTLAFQNPKNVLSIQYPKSTMSFQSPVNSLLKTPIAVLNHHQPSKAVLNVDSPKNVLTIQTPHNFALSPTSGVIASVNKGATNTLSSSQPYVSTSYPVGQNNNYNYYHSSNANVPSSSSNSKPYSTFLGQTLVKNDPPESYYAADAIQASNQAYQSSASRTVLTPVKVEDERGPIYTIPAPNLSLGREQMQANSNYKPVVQQPSAYSYQGQKAQPSYEVTEPPVEKTHYQNREASHHHQQYTTGGQFSPMISNIQHYPKQQPAQTLSTEEFYNLLNSVTPQQQLPDIYSTPLLQQPQLQQHFLQKNVGANIPLQPFNAIIQPIYSSKGNTQDANIFFKPDIKYVQNIPDQYLNQVNADQPSYGGTDEVETLKAEIESLVHQHDSSNVHYNIVRNTEEGSLAINNEIKDGKNEYDNHVSNSDENSNVFVPTPVPETNGDLSVSKPVSASYYTQVSGPESSLSNFFPPLTNKEVEETLATIQAASDLMKVAKSQQNKGRDSSYSSSSFQPYFSQNSQQDNPQNQFVSQTNNAFSPIKGFSVTVTNDDESVKEKEGPLKIYVPDQYDDAEVPQTQDIQISASMNAQDNDNEQNIVGSYNSVNVENDNLQGYASYPQVPENIETTRHNLQDNNEKTTINNILPHPEDIIVLLQRNNTDPSLDILTKDWKTSIVIKSKDKDRISPGENRLNGEFGNRLRLKRNE